jgi:hypothetical protein
MDSVMQVSVIEIDYHDGTCSHVWPTILMPVKSSTPAMP